MSFLLVPWKGASGEVYHGALFRIGEQLPTASGVYVACRSNLLGWTALYVGQSVDFSARIGLNLGQHDGMARAASMGATHLSLIQIYSASYRIDVETDLRHGLNPPANAQPVPRNALADWLRA